MQELRTVKTYKHNMLDKMSVFDRHRCHMADKFSVFVEGYHCTLPTLYWLPKLHKRPYKSRFIANSSSCTTMALSILWTSCLTGIINHFISRVAANNWFLLLKSPTLEHILIKRVSCKKKHYKKGIKNISDPGPNCLQRLSADEKVAHARKQLKQACIIIL